MAARDLPRRWLPPIGIAVLVALTVLDVVLIKLAFDRAEGPAAPPASHEDAPSASPDTPEPTPSTAGSREPRPTTGAAVPDGSVLLALAEDGTILRATTDTCQDSTRPQVVVSRPGSAGFREVPVASDLGTVLAVEADRRGQLLVVGTDTDCEVAAYRGGARQRSWTAEPAQDEWYLDVTRDPALVHAPGGRVDVPCPPAALSTLDAVRLLCDDGRIVGTGDAGETWVALGRLEDASAMAFQGPSRGIALARRDDCPVASLETADGGSSWETLGCLEGDTGRAVALRGDAVVAVVDDALWASDDGGSTWTRRG